MNEITTDYVRLIGECIQRLSPCFRTKPIMASTWLQSGARHGVLRATLTLATTHESNNTSGLDDGADANINTHVYSAV